MHADRPRHGHGKQVWEDGSVYEGEWRDDQMHGTGDYIWPDGRHFKGDWVAG